MKFYIKIFLSILFITVIVKGSIVIPDFRKIEIREPALLYKLKRAESKSITEQLQKAVYQLDLDRNDLKPLLKSIIYESETYYNDKYNISELNKETLVDSAFADLKGSSYFRKRIKKWSDSTALEYLTFRAELNFIEVMYPDFDLDLFRETETYKYISEGLAEDSISTEMIDSLLSNVSVYGYNPLHFYYKPNSVKEQWKQDKIDINRINFKTVMTFYNKYADVLAEAEEIYGVNKEIIIGILKRETNLGRVKLKYNPFEVLLGQATRYINNPASTDKIQTKQAKRIERLRRSARRSLKHLIRYCLHNNMDPDSIKSNFVGAVGYTQFMPFNLYLATDGDDDGKADLSHMPDAIMSIGNFFNHNGWKKKYELKKKDKRSIKKQIMHYNSNPSYAQAVYEIACRIEELAEKGK